MITSDDDDHASFVSTTHVAGTLAISKNKSQIDQNDWIHYKENT